MKRKICIITGSRAEYGLLYWIIKGIHEDSVLQLQLVVTGMHLSPEFGLTVKEIEKDRLPIAERVEMLLSSDTEKAIALSMGLGITGLASAYERLKPDILLVLGDRFEILSAVAAAVPFRIPIAHIHGGESTEGAMDESFRHAITKMSHIHFPSTEEYKKRILQMGENPARVFCFGAPGLDSIKKLNLLTRQQLSKTLNLPLDKAWGVVTYHPVTLEIKNSDKKNISEILHALNEFYNVHWIFTLPNAETDSRTIIRDIKEHVQREPESSSLVGSLGQLKYLSLLQHASLMVGNSSSGLIEAPSFQLPVVNIGKRQQGRIRSRNVIDVTIAEKGSIINAIKKALSYRFKTSLKNLKNPYGSGDASKKIIKVLKTISLHHIQQKKFYKV
ncbi:MAG: UDP-N-acetylglucosamine 2-epimerase [Nitrospirota bacterium]